MLLKVSRQLGCHRHDPFEVKTKHFPFQRFVGLRSYGKTNALTVCPAIWNQRSLHLVGVLRTYVLVKTTFHMLIPPPPS